MFFNLIISKLRSWIGASGHEMFAICSRIPLLFRATPKNAIRTTHSQPEFTVENVVTAFAPLATAISHDLHHNGFFTSTNLLPPTIITTIRNESIVLRETGRFEQSWSEGFDSKGNSRRFDKEGVFACEPDGGDYELAPHLLTYMTGVITHLPRLLNNCDSGIYSISDTAYNAKLAVTEPGGSTYPLHVDNPLGLSASPADTRKLTCILYLNPNYCIDDDDGGELRLVVSTNSATAPVDLTPVGGRIVLFWSDEIPHEVLPTGSNCDDRFALTLWLPTSNAEVLHSETSKFRTLRYIDG